jgi:hypothetical protein
VRPRASHEVPCGPLECSSGPVDDLSTEHGQIKSFEKPAWSCATLTWVGGAVPPRAQRLVSELGRGWVSQSLQIRSRAYLQRIRSGETKFYGSGRPSLVNRPSSVRWRKRPSAQTHASTHQPDVLSHKCSGAKPCGAPVRQLGRWPQAGQARTSAPRASHMPCTQVATSSGTHPAGQPLGLVAAVPPGRQC